MRGQLANLRFIQCRPKKGECCDPASKVIRVLPRKILGRHLYVWTHSSECQRPRGNFLPLAVEMHAGTVERGRDEMPLPGWECGGCGQAVFFAHPEDQNALPKCEVSCILFQRIANARKQSGDRSGLLALKPAVHGPRRSCLQYRVSRFHWLTETVPARAEHSAVRAVGRRCQSQLGVRRPQTKPSREDQHDRDAERDNWSHPFFHLPHDPRVGLAGARLRKCLLIQVVLANAWLKEARRLSR